MTDFYLEPTHATPLVRIDQDEGRIELSGKSSPENAVKFYLPIVKTAFDTFRDQQCSITVDVSFRYFNTSSSKCLFNFFKMLKVLEQNGSNVSVNWYYEEDDEDMLEIGGDYAELLNLRFNYVEVDLISGTFLRQAV